MSYVSLVSIQNNSNFKDDIKKSLYLIDFNFKTNVEKVVIKPNLCYYWDYTTGQTTDPKFIGGLIDLLREEIDPDVDISIVESDASVLLPLLEYRPPDRDTDRRHRLRPLQ